MADLIVPSKYQKRIYKEFTETKNNISIGACAGSGKTTTLVELLNFVPPHEKAIFVAFNKHITVHLKNKIAGNDNVHISTINSFGARMLYKNFGSIALVENKYFLIALRLFKNNWKLKENKWSYCYEISKIVDVMRFMLCYEDEQLIYDACAEYNIGIYGDEIQHAQQVFEIGMKNINQIDFLDQVFQPVVRKIKFVKYHYTFTDESQDFSKLQHEFIKRLILPGVGRLISVGDRNQAIYKFAGASGSSFDNLKNLLPYTVELPLSICYRCDNEIIKLAQTIVPTIEARPNAKKGIVREAESWTEIKDGDAVLCRMTKPLVILFRELLRNHKKATIKGREIGQNLINLIKKTKALTIEQCLKKIDVYEFDLRQKLYKTGCYKPDQHVQMLMLVEKKEIIKILSSDFPTIKLLIKKIGDIFVENSDDGIQLMTIHRAKGLEFNRVFLLNKDLIPSPYACSKDELEQEKNLLYVAYTRAKKEFVFLQFEEEED